MTLLSFVDAVGRELISSAIAAKVEATELMMGLHLGIGLTTFLRGHIRVDILIVLLPRRLRADPCPVDLVRGLICLRLGKLSLVKLDQGEFTQIWEVPLSPVIVVMVLCSVLMFAVPIIKWVQAIRIAVGVAASPILQPAQAPGNPAGLQWNRSS